MKTLPPTVVVWDKPSIQEKYFPNGFERNARDKSYDGNTKERKVLTVKSKNSEDNQSKRNSSNRIEE